MGENFFFIFLKIIVWFLPFWCFLKMSHFDSFIKKVRILKEEFSVELTMRQKIMDFSLNLQSKSMFQVKKSEKLWPLWSKKWKSIDNGYEKVQTRFIERVMWTKKMDSSPNLLSKSLFWQNKFLDGSTNLYMRVCPSVGPSVGWMVGWSVTCFFQMPKIDNFL